ncbi:MAG TPA: hypothetical protein VLE97_09060 [Gaiellaceae bacterium]|nr:hypothetical protein [Gaiellaceae bacterium]
MPVTGPWVPHEIRSTQAFGGSQAAVSIHALCVQHLPCSAQAFAGSHASADRSRAGMPARWRWISQP